MRGSDQTAEEQLPKRLLEHVEFLAGQIGPRYPARPESLDAAAAYIENQFASCGYPVERQTFRIDDQPVANLIAERQGAGRAEEIVVVGAHYDTIPATPGADDNASAVAMLLETARLLRASEFKRTLRFVAFTCEELPYAHTDQMGSQVYARRCRQRGERIVGMICLEMVGYYSTEPGGQQLPKGIPRFLRWAFPRRGDFIASVGNPRSWRLVWKFRQGFRRATRFPLFSIVLPEAIREIRRSDNSSFWDQGYPALMLTDTSFLRNPHYHQATDMPETLDYESMSRAALGLAGGISRLAGRVVGDSSDAL